MCVCMCVCVCVCVCDLLVNSVVDFSKQVRVHFFAYS